MRSSAIREASSVFLLLLVAGLAAAIFLCRRERPQAAGRSLKLAAAPLTLGLLLQLILFPAIWFSSGAGSADIAISQAAVSVLRWLNIVFLLVFGLAIWRRQQLEAWLNRRNDAVSRLSAAVLLAAFLLLAGAQHEALHAQAAALLFISAVALLAILGALLLASNGDALTRRAYRAALLSLGLGYAGVALPIAVGHYSLGYVFERTLVLSSLSQVIVGLVWGLSLGFLVQRSRPSAAQLMERTATVGALLAVALVIVCVVLPRLDLIPRFRDYASEWDARHARIVQLRNSGQRDVLVAPYSFDMTAYVSSRGLPMGKISTYYYDLDSVTVAEP